MFVVPVPVAAVETALDLVDTFAAHDVLPPVRAGVATGDVLARAGDYSGPVVNLAARTTARARPSTLLVDVATADALAGVNTVSYRHAGTFTLKGFDRRVRLVRVKRVDARDG
jgi:adenylate cyclase